MIKNTNPDSYCWVRIGIECQPQKVFAYFYICCDSLKRGRLTGCRKIIDLDGCFFKGTCKGKLLFEIEKKIIKYFQLTG